MFRLEGKRIPDALGPDGRLAARGRLALSMAEAIKHDVKTHAPSCVWGISRAAGTVQALSWQVGPGRNTLEVSSVASSGSFDWANPTLGPACGPDFFDESVWYAGAWVLYCLSWLRSGC